MKKAKFFAKTALSSFLLGILSIFINSIALNLGMTDRVYMPCQDTAAWILLCIPVLLYILLCIRLKKAAAVFQTGSTVLWLLACGLGILLCMMPYMILMLFL